MLLSLILVRRRLWLGVLLAGQLPLDPSKSQQKRLRFLCFCNSELRRTPPGSHALSDPPKEYVFMFSLGFLVFFRFSYIFLWFSLLFLGLLMPPGLWLRMLLLCQLPLDPSKQRKNNTNLEFIEHLQNIKSKKKQQTQ